MYTCGDPLAGYKKTILEHAAAAGATGRGRDSSDGLFRDELANARSTPDDRAAVVGRIVRCCPASDGRSTDRGLRDRVRFVPGPRAVVEVAAGAPGRGRDSCGGAFGSDHLDSRKCP